MALKDIWNEIWKQAFEIEMEKVSYLDQNTENSHSSELFLKKLYPDFSDITKLEEYLKISIFSKWTFENITFSKHNITILHLCENAHTSVRANNSIKRKYSALKNTNKMLNNEILKPSCESTILDTYSKINDFSEAKIINNIYSYNETYNIMLLLKSLFLFSKNSKELTTDNLIDLLDVIYSDSYEVSHSKSTSNDIAPDYIIHHFNETYFNTYFLFELICILDLLRTKYEENIKEECNLLIKKSGNFSSKLQELIDNDSDFINLISRIIANENELYKELKTIHKTNIFASSKSTIKHPIIYALIDFIIDENNKYNELEFFFQNNEKISNYLKDILHYKNTIPLKTKLFLINDSKNDEYKNIKNLIENIDKSNMPETLLPTVVKYNVYQTFYFIFFYNAIELGKIKSPYMKHFYLNELYETFITCINTSMHNNIDIKDLPNIFHTIDKKLYNVYQDAVEANELFTSLYKTISEKLQCHIPDLQPEIDKRKTFFEDETELNFTLTNYINPLYSKTKHILHKKSSSNMILDLVNIHHSNYCIPQNYHNHYNNLFSSIRIFDMVQQEDNTLPITSHFSAFRKLLDN